MYNFFSIAEADNARLHRPGPRLAEAKQSAARKPLETFSSPKRKYEENQMKSVKRSKLNSDTSTQGEEEVAFDNPSVQREVTRAGYTPTPPIPEEFALLTPVSRNSRR